MSTETAGRAAREQLATALEREAALLRRTDFDVTEIRYAIDDDPRFSSRTVCIQVDWDTGNGAAWVDTWDEYHGYEYEAVYDSVQVDGRYAHAYRTAHHPEDDIWYLRVHQRDQSHLGERWFGGSVLLDADSHRFLGMKRATAIEAADTWAHHGELPPNAVTSR